MITKLSKMAVMLTAIVSFSTKDYLFIGFEVILLIEDAVHRRENQWLSISHHNGMFMLCHVPASFANHCPAIIQESRFCGIG